MHCHLRLSVPPVVLGALLHQPTKFQQNRSMRGRVIVDCTTVPGPFIRGGFVLIFSQRWSVIDLREIWGKHRQIIGAPRA